LEAGLDEFEERDELAEDEDLLAFVAEFFEALEEGVEFGAGDLAVGAGNEGGMAADLAEAEEAREDVEAHGVEGAGGFDTEELGAGALEFGVVKGALFAVEIDEDDVFGARRELGGDLCLRAAQHEVADAAAEAGGGGGILDGILAAEAGLAAEETGLGEGEEAPEIEQAVLDGRAGEGDAVERGNRAGDGSGLARGVLDELGFVEDYGVPTVAVEPLGVEAELGVVDDEDRGAVGGAGHTRGEGNQRRERLGGELRGEALGLGEPAVHDALGADDESAERFRGAGGGVGVRLVQEPREGLHGSAETHVVGQDAAKAAGGEVREKLEALLLVGPQGCAQAGGQGRSGDRGESGGALAKRVGEEGVFDGEGVDLGDELERVEAVLGGLAGGEHVLGAQAEAVERGFGAVVGGLRELEAAPTVAGEADPFAAGLEEERKFVGLEFGVLNAEFDGEVEPVAALAGGGSGGDSTLPRSAGPSRPSSMGEASISRSGGSVSRQARNSSGNVFDIERAQTLTQRFHVRRNSPKRAAMALAPLRSNSRSGSSAARGAGALPGVHCQPRSPSQDLFAGRVAGAGEELRVEIFGGVGLGVGGAPALDDGAERDTADAAFEGGGQAEARGRGGAT